MKLKKLKITNDIEIAEVESGKKTVLIAMSKNMINLSFNRSVDIELIKDAYLVAHNQNEHYGKS